MPQAELCVDDADRPGNRGRLRHDRVRAHRDVIAAGAGDVTHRDDDRFAAFLGLAHRPPYQVRTDRRSTRRIDAEDYRAHALVVRRSPNLVCRLLLDKKKTHDKRFAYYYRSDPMDQRKTWPVPAFAHEGDVAKVARNPHKRPPVSLRVEFVAQVLDIARAVHERGLACRAHAHKAPAQKLTRPRNLDPSRSRYSFGEHRLPVRDYRLEALAQFRRHRVRVNIS